MVKAHKLPPHLGLMGLCHLQTSEPHICLMYDSQACVTCIHKFFTLQVHTALMSEYTCAQAIMMSQTQVDFKAGEYVNPAYIAYIQIGQLRQVYKKLKHGKSWK